MGSGFRDLGFRDLRLQYFRGLRQSPNKLGPTMCDRRSESGSELEFLEVHTGEGKILRDQVNQDFDHVPYSGIVVLRALVTGNRFMLEREPDLC